MSTRGYPFALIALIVAGSACSSSSNGATPAAGSDGGTGADGAPGAADSAPRGGDGTGLVCPSAPSNVAITLPAPVWSGLIVFEATVDGTFDSIEVEQLDATANVWFSIGASNRQRADGRYAVLVQPHVREENRKKDLKLRGRTRLFGCAPSAWVETKTFQLTDPLTTTTWASTITPLQSDAQINVSATGVGTTQGPYFIAATPPMTHSILFNADNSTTESLTFTVKSGHAGDLYDGCTIELQLPGNWQFLPTGQYCCGGLPIVVARSKPKLGPGTKCTAPPVADLAISQPTFAGVMPQAQWNFSIDYAPLLDTPPGKPRFDDPNTVQNLINAALPLLQDVVGPDTANINGYFRPTFARYEKQ